jgi:protein-S-isoprenylcysteine O-methyltransferase Ste14
MKRMPPLLLLVLCATAMWLVAPASEPASSARIMLASALVLSGIVVAVAGVVEFRRAGTTVDPRVPHKAQELVTSGIFAFSRNPMYVGMVLVLIAWSIALDSWLAALVCPVFYVWIDRVQIPFEEKHIVALFGDDYTRYCQRVRRWI